MKEVSVVTSDHPDSKLSEKKDVVRWFSTEWFPKISNFWEEHDDGGEDREHNAIETFVFKNICIITKKKYCCYRWDEKLFVCSFMIKAWSLSAISSSERNKRMVICVFCSIAFPDVYLRLPLYMISFGFFFVVFTRCYFQTTPRGCAWNLSFSGNSFPDFTAVRILSWALLISTCTKCCGLSREKFIVKLEFAVRFCAQWSADIERFSLF